MNNISIKSTRFLGTVPGLHTPNWTVIGQDGGQSISLGDKYLFVFSDTLITSQLNTYSKKVPAAPYPTPFGNQGIFLPNCAGVSSKKDLYQALSNLSYYTNGEGFLCPILETTPRERDQQLRFWPEHGILINDKVYLYYLGIQTIDPNSIWGFRNLGTGLAILDPGSGDCQRVFHQGDWCLWKVLTDDFHFGVQVIGQGDEIYIFASVRDGLLSTARLARVHAAAISDPTTYEYLCAIEPEPLWSKHITKAYDLGECSSDFSVSYNQYIQKYTMIYIDEYEKRIMLRTADNIWGPYSSPIKIISVPAKKSSELVYLGFEHPIFRKNNGKTIYISYCQPYFTANSVLAITFW